MQWILLNGCASTGIMVESATNKRASSLLPVGTLYLAALSVCVDQISVIAAISSAQRSTRMIDRV